MLREERHQLILKWLHSERKIIATDLSIRLNVSEDTIRRDLRELDAAGLLRRVHGGALIIGPPVVDFDERQSVATEAKISLAKTTLQLVQNGQVIIIDGGTTNLHFTNHLPLDLHATVITNSPPVAVALKSHPNIEVIMIGGKLFKQSLVTVGATVIDSLDYIRADLYILGVYNLHPQIGISYPNQEEALVKRKIISISTEVAALVTLDKLGTAAPFIAAPISALTHLITESHVEEEILKPYTKNDIVVLQG